MSCQDFGFDFIFYILLYGSFTYILKLKFCVSMGFVNGQMNVSLHLFWFPMAFLGLFSVSSFYHILISLFVLFSFIYYPLDAFFSLKERQKDDGRWKERW